MQSSRPVIRWVSDSDVRSALLRTLSSGPRPTARILDTVSASESAIYQALSDLERRDLLAEQHDGWVLTGRGQLVADLLSQRAAVEKLLATDEAYWQNHDVSVLPREFRLRLGALQDHEIVRVTETDPNRVVRFLTEHVSGAESVQILAPVYQEDVAEAMPDTQDTRLVLTPEIVEGVFEQSVAEPSAEPEQMAIRIGEAPLPMTLTEDALLVSFPTLDGKYDSRTEVVAESEAALQWGSDLFSYYWQRARPIPE